MLRTVTNHLSTSFRKGRPSTLPIRIFHNSSTFEMPPKEKYTDPKLRDQVKEEIHQSDKGGQPGQWSARKAQMMAAEYKKRGGDVSLSIPIVHRPC